MDVELSKIFLSAGAAFPLDYRQETAPLDVIAQLNNGDQFVATLLSYHAFERMFPQYRQTGDWLEGKYWWNPNIILIESYEQRLVRRVLKHMLDEGTFWLALRKV